MRFRLAAKIVILFIFAEALSLLVLSYVFIQYGRILIEDEIRERGEAVSSFLARASAYPVLAWNADLVFDSAKVVMLQKDIVGLEITDVHGKVLLALGDQGDSNDIMQFNADIYGESQKFVDEEAVIGNLENASQRLGKVKVFMTRHGIQRDIRRLKLTVFTIASLTFFITAVIGIYSVHYFVGRPLGRLMQGVERVSRGDLDTTIEINTSDELERLSHALNKMVVALKANFRRRIEETEKQALERNLMIMGELASMLIHEVGNMLNRFSVIEYQLAEENLSDRGRELIENFQKELKSLQKFTENVRLFSKKPELHLKSIDIVNFLKVIVASFKFMNPKGLIYSFDSDVEKCQIYGDEDALRQVIVNLITNAADVSNEGSRVNIRLRKLDEHVRIEVEDHGPGIAEEDSDKVFRPFFTTKGPLGTGLGLAIVRSMVEAHDGRIYFRSQPGKGTTFFVELPLLRTS